jgi:flagellar biosynthesis GTPase FlhF
MDFEKIIPFILLLIMWGAGRILNRTGKAGQKKQAPADKKPILVKILQQLAAIKEKSMEEEFFENSHQPMEDEQESESLIDIVQESLLQEVVTTDKKTVSVSPPTGAAKARPTTLCKKPLVMMNRSKLRNAVIWAEILAPPVALRD